MRIHPYYLYIYLLTRSVDGKLTVEEEEGKENGMEPIMRDLFKFLRVDVKWIGRKGGRERGGE